MSEKKEGREGWSAVRQYFLSSHGQLADRLTRPLLAQHTNLASGSPLPIVNACLLQAWFVLRMRARVCCMHVTCRYKEDGK